MNKITDSIKKYRYIIFAIIVAMVGILLIGKVVNVAKAKSATKQDPTANSVFFIKNEEGFYALFNSKGKQLTEFIYSAVGDVYNGVAKVKTKDDGVGIINEKGKYEAHLSAYEAIDQHGSLFKVYKSEKEYYLINKDGKKIISKGVFEVLSTNTQSYIIVLKDDKYIVFNYNGKEIYSFKLSESKEEDVLPTIDEFGDYGSVYYNGLDIVFNYKTGRVISKIKDDNKYCISGVSEDEETILLNSCVAWYEESKDPEFKAIIKNKVKDLPKSCTNAILNNDVIACTTDNGVYLLNDKLKVTKADLVNITYVDSENYAIAKDKTIKFVKNNKVKNTLKDAILSDKGYSKTGIYLVYQDEEYSFYDLKGKKLFKKSFESATAFDSNSLAKVSDDGEKHYFINTKGKKVSGEFDLAYLTKDYYIITNDNKKGVMDQKGNIVIEVKYSDAEIKNYNDTPYASLKKGDTYYLVNLNNKKEVLKTKTQPMFYDNYIKIVSAKKTEYYTYNGNKLFEEKNEEVEETE